MDNAMSNAAARGIVPPAPGFLRVLARPRIVALASIVVLADLGWAYLGLMVAGTAHGGQTVTLGPGMGLFDLFTASGLDTIGRALVEALCRPSFGSAAGLAGSFGAGHLALVWSMWVAMVLAMMLPTAAPMVTTYTDIAGTAAAKQEAVVSPLMLIAGYGAVWLGFALAATLAQWGLARLALLDSAMASASALFSGAVFIGAGVYQFSALKHACLTRCQRPFPFIFANWTTAPSGVFRLGLRQGLDCLGCCWAMMLVMFAVGVMNVVWIAVLGVIMAGEKLGTGTRFSRAVGVVFVTIGVAFVSSAIAAHWPARAG
jgi:predicted metal-binding membrane protein